MLLRTNVCVGLTVAALLALAPAARVYAGPAKSPAKAAKAKPAAKPSVKPATCVGKTPTETVARLIAAMRRKDKAAIGTAFNWNRFAAEMNKLIPGEKGLDAGTYRTLLVETLDVEPAVSTNLRVGKETAKGADVATVEMRRVFPSGSGKTATNQVKTINILSLGKEKDGWRIFRLDSAQTVSVPPPTPAVPRAPQGMVPAAGS
ncbi:MAG TPA: hypothetical protein VGM37_15520 [Armatimonadota bacterium]